MEELLRRVTTLASAETHGIKKVIFIPHDAREGRRSIPPRIEIITDEPMRIVPNLDELAEGLGMQVKGVTETREATPSTYDHVTAINGARLMHPKRGTLPVDIYVNYPSTIVLMHKRGEIGSQHTGKILATLRELIPEKRKLY